jgi:hypothetical protein
MQMLMEKVYGDERVKGNLWNGFFQIYLMAYYSAYLKYLSAFLKGEGTLNRPSFALTSSVSVCLNEGNSV